MKLYLRALGYSSVSILVLTLILTILHYFNLMGDNAVYVFKLLISTISIAAGGYIVGKAAPKRGWLEGLKFSILMIIIFVILSLLFKLGLDTKAFIYYAIIIASSTIGSMIGISRKEEKD